MGAGMLLTIARLFFGVAWVGTASSSVLFFETILRVAGPKEGIVHARLRITESPMIWGLSSIAILAAGLALYRQAAGETIRNWMSAPAGLAMGTAAVAAILCLVLGIAVLLAPFCRRMRFLQQKEDSLAESPAASSLHEMRCLQERMLGVSRWGEVLMVVTAIGVAMAWELAWLS